MDEGQPMAFDYDVEFLRLDNARLAAESALSQVGFRHIAPLEVVAQRKQVIFRAMVLNQGGGLLEVPRPLAVRVMEENVEFDAISSELAAADALALRGAPIVAPLHGAPIVTETGIVGLWEWMEPCDKPVSMAGWGHALGRFHEAGSDLRIVGKYDPLQGFALEGLFGSAEMPGHPLQAHPDLLARFSEAFAEARLGAEAAAKAVPNGFLHGDAHRSNCQGSPVVLYDLEFSGWGPLADDFTRVALGVRRYGWPSSYLDEFKRGYGEKAPTDAEIAPFARLRELVLAGWVLQGAGDNNQYRMQMDDRIAIIDNPEVIGRPWVHVGDVPMMDVSRVSDAPMRAVADLRESLPIMAESALDQIGDATMTESALADSLVSEAEAIIADA